MQGEATPHSSGLSLDEATTKAREIVDYAQHNGIPLRLLGALAITLGSLESKKHCYLFLQGRVGDQEKPFTDLDFVGYSRDKKKICTLLESLGYRSRGGLTDLEFGRLVYTDKNGIHVDVFLDTLAMCHTIDFRGRLDLDEITVPLADLLLSKMQIVNIDTKDIGDSVCLLLDHEVGTEDQDMINVRHIAKTLADDWGFYYTASTNLRKIRNEFRPIYENRISKEETKELDSKIDVILDAIEREPKPLAWKMRAKVGPRMKWYQDVDAA